MENIKLSDEAKRSLKHLDSESSKLLRKSCSFGDVYIITNAAKGWVEYSSRKYMPKTVKELMNAKCRIISARTKYEEIYPGDCFAWKVKAFSDIKKYMVHDAVTNLIAIGDSKYEIEAAKLLANEFPVALIKTVKFREGPTPDELVKQLRLVNERIETVFANPKNLTIRLERKKSSVEDTPKIPPQNSSEKLPYPTKEIDNGQSGDVN